MLLIWADADGALEEQLLIGESGLAHPVQTESDEDGRPLELLQQPARFSQKITPTAGSRHRVSSSCVSSGGAGDRSVVVATVLTAQAAECAKPTGDLPSAHTSCLVVLRRGRGTI